MLLMFVTPEEARWNGLRVHRGRYDKGEVDRLLDEIVSSYELVWRERDALRERIYQLDEQLDDFRSLERDLRDGILTAQRAAGQLREEAEQERQRLLESARNEAEALGRAALDERTRLVEEVRRLEALEAELQSNFRAFLLAALDLLENRPQPAQ